MSQHASQDEPTDATPVLRGEGQSRWPDEHSTNEKLLITLCTYNERENLKELTSQIFAAMPRAEVLVIDDNSPDGTGRLADELATADPRIHVLHRPGKLGLGSATVAGFAWAIDNGYDWLINMDADFSHHPRFLEALWSARHTSDVVIGSRYVSGGAITGWGPLRHVMSRGVNTYARALLRLKTRDNSGAFRCYRVNKLAELDLTAVRSRGYAFEEEILYRCRRNGCRFHEVPIVFEDRRHGQSKINSLEVARAVWDIFCLGWHNLRRVPVGRPGEKQPLATDECLSTEPRQEMPS